MTRNLWVYVGLIGLFVGGLLGGIYAYAGVKTLPRGLAPGGWNAGGLTIESFQQQWKEREAQIGRVQASFASGHPDVPSSTLKLKDFGARLEAKGLEDLLQRWSEGNWIERAAARWKLSHYAASVTVVLDEEATKKAVATAWPLVQARKPVDAKRLIGADDGIRYVSEVSVVRIDPIWLMDELEEQINHVQAWTLLGLKKPLVVALPVYSQNAGVTVDMLKAQGITRNIMEFTTSFRSGQPGREHNIRSTANVLQDYLLAPGEVFDYDKIVETTEQRFGFKEAPVIVGGKLAQGVGGGICQVSTTLYNAVLRAGLEVVERRNHSLPVSYVPLGQDCTFSDNYLNFKFRNSTDHHLLVRTEMKDLTLTVKLFGDIPPDVTYDVTSKIIETIAPTVKYVYNPELAPGAEQVLTEGKPGYVVETYRTMKKGGVVVSTERVSRDRYLAEAQVVATGTKQPSKEPGVKPPEAVKPSPAPLLEDGLRR